MQFREQRRAARVSCRLPVRIYGAASDLDATIQDVSRTGVRLEIPLAGVGVQGAADLLVLARSVEHHVGARFNMDLNPQVLGPLVRKHLRVVRIGREGEERGVLELGCAFGVPLSDDESGVLDLALPPLGALAPLPVRPGPPARRYEAYVHATRGWQAGTLPGTSSALQEGAATFRASRATGFDASGLDLPTLALALAGAYGPEPVLEIRRGAQPLWRGRTSIRHIESRTPASSEVQVRLDALDPHPA